MNDPFEIAKRLEDIQEKIEYFLNLVESLEKEKSELMITDVWLEGESIPFCNCPFCNCPFCNCPFCN